MCRGSDLRIHPESHPDDEVQWSLFPSPHTDSSSRSRQFHPCSISQLQPVVAIAPPPSSKPPQLSLCPASHTHMHTHTIHQQRLHLLSRVISQFLPTALTQPSPWPLAHLIPNHHFQIIPSLASPFRLIKPLPQAFTAHCRHQKGLLLGLCTNTTPPSQHSGLSSNEPPHTTQLKGAPPHHSSGTQPSLHRAQPPET